MNKINQVNLFKMQDIEGLKPIKLNGNISLNSDETNVKSFKEVVGDMMASINEVTNKPEQMANAAMQWKADIHDVMASIAQSELTVQAATTITGKILQTYEKIMQIQI